ncbi:MAG: recombinase family protein, partial [Lentisphaerae bacterium]|nr:recombinase family protein [Lentisphaerota bacterium]
MKRTVETVSFPLTTQPKMIRVAAYARVSSGKDAMLHSLSAQVSYYSEMIQHHPGWLYCGVYADEALTGTKDSRENFQRLIADCRSGKIDLVITKSISRFARNTVTLLETVRELKSLGIDVFFEEQNIYTSSCEGEVMLTILASYAQEESRSASENQKWRIRKSYEQGEVLQWRHLFGYDITKDSVTVNPVQAEIVREIFDRAISGESFGTISRDLNKRGIKTAFGNTWHQSRIRDILSCEKYIGDAVLQKKYVNNHIEKKLVKNNGKLPMYYAEGTHKPIIDRSTFEKAQDILRRWDEKTKGHSPHKHYPFSGKIVCGS